MRTVLVILCAIAMSGCMYNDDGWSVSGYQKTNSAGTWKIGSIGPELGQMNGLDEFSEADCKRHMDHDLTENSPVIGILFKKEF